MKNVFNLNPNQKSPYSDAAIGNGLAYIAGQMSIDPQTQAICPGTIREEATLALNNLKSVVEGLGATLEDVLFVNNYMPHPEDFPEFSEIYSQMFPINPPARATLYVKELYGDLRIELTAVVALTE